MTRKVPHCLCGHEGLYYWDREDVALRNGPRKRFQLQCERVAMVIHSHLRMTACLQNVVIGYLCTPLFLVAIRAVQKCNSQAEYIWTVASMNEDELAAARQVTTRGYRSTQLDFLCSLCIQDHDCNYYGDFTTNKGTFYDDTGELREYVNKCLEQTTLDVHPVPIPASKIGNVFAISALR